MEASRVLLVDSNPGTLDTLQAALEPIADVDRAGSFPEARQLLLERSYERLFTNLRLRNYNGIHLAHLAGLETRAIVYTTRREVFLQAEVQMAGAFYERLDRLFHSIASYVENALPPRDRRHAGHDRRESGFRGGRRASDRLVRFGVSALAAESRFRW